MTKFFAILLLFVVIFHHAQAFSALDDEETDQSPLPQVRCKEHICSRIYRPLCIVVEGEQKTLPSRCHFKNLRCNAMKRSQADARPAPVFRVMHEGIC